MNTFIWYLWKKPQYFFKCFNKTYQLKIDEKNIKATSFNANKDTQYLMSKAIKMFVLLH